MRKGIVRVGVVLAGLLLLIASLVYLSVSTALAGSGTVGSEVSQALAPAGGGESQMAPRPRTNTPTRTPARTPTRTPTPMNTPTNTPIPSCGLAWRDVPAANPGSALYGIEVVSANDIWAVGLDYTGPTARTLIEHWNGTQWAIVPSPNVGTESSYLFKVSAVSASDIWAIGTHNGRTLALHWDGAQWSIVSTPNPGTNENYLLDVKAVSANDVWAVGYFRSGSPYPFQMFIAHWDGKSWSQVPSPNTGFFSNVLTSVDAISANDIWAVGYSMAQNAPASQTQTLTIHWNGSSWSVVPSGSFNQLNSVSAVSSNDVWAVGSNELYDITMHWNGSFWSEVPSPEPGNNSINLNDVEAISSNDVWAVGYYESLAVGGTVPLMIHWDGTQWNQVERDWGTAPDFLTAVDAVSSTDVWAAGYNYTDGLFFVHYSDPCALPDGGKR
ncbi:MAG TPA: hypothetical protein VGE45_09285 [Chloroflexia bacterium]